MEWLNVVITPLLAFLGVVVSSVFVLKTKKLELADKDKKDLYDIVKNVVAGLDEVKQTQTEFSFALTEVKNDVKELGDVTKRLSELEKDFAVLSDRVNRA